MCRITKTFLNVSSGGGFGRGVGKKFVSNWVTQDLAQDHPSIPFTRNCLSLEFYTFSFRSMFFVYPILENFSGETGLHLIYIGFL